VHGVPTSPGAARPPIPPLGCSLAGGRGTLAEATPLRGGGGLGGCGVLGDPVLALVVRLLVLLVVLVLLALIVRSTRRR
jgi:hypothetical protein